MTATSQPLSLGQLLIYGSMASPIAVIGLPMAIYLAPFYAGELGLPLALLGLAMIVSRISDVITDPLIGFLSDRWRPQIGRRRVWVMLGMAIMVAGVYLLFRPPQDVGLVYFLIALSVVYLGFTVLELPYRAWGAELSPDYHVRTRITSAREFFTIVGLIAATVIPAWILSQDGATSADVLSGLSLFVFIALPLTAFAVVTMVPEPKRLTQTTPLKPGRALAMLARNGPFARIAILLMLATTGEVFRQTITLFFARDVIGVENVGMIYVYYFLTGLAAVPFWLWLGNTIGKHKALATAFFAITVICAGMFFLQPGQTTVFTLAFMAKGFCFGALTLLPTAMIADTVDIDTVYTGDRQQGLFYAIAAMIQKFGFAIGQGLPLNLLALIGFQAGGGNGPQELFWLSFFYCLFPAVFMLIAARLAWNYPLTAVRHKKLQAFLERRSLRAGDPLP